ncbi:MAG: aminotransferase class V-fold PLP-dependent enzyme [Caldithrix sp.]|nr:aminotransferase class V-fold PLP-dependent enzyme [Caldithrix sp.]
MVKAYDINSIHEQIVGWDRHVPLLNGKQTRYINFDNAASTPTLKPVLEALNEFMQWYSSIHRGTGFKSQLSTHLYEQSREIVRRFFNIRDENHTIIFGKNSTEAINKLARRLPLDENDIILTTLMEHHSNDLPWRMRERIDHIGLEADSRLDMQDLRNKLEIYKGKVRLVSITGASNVSGYINPIPEIARLVHSHNAELMVDAAQLAPHRAIDMGDQDDPEHIDYLAFSAHKIYAPFGLGVLIANRDVFKDGNPDHVGGGTIELVSIDHVLWADVPEQEEAGTPNVAGAIALGKALQVMQEIGMDTIADHEARLTAYTLKKLKQVPGIDIYGSMDENDVHNRLGVIPFNLQDKSHALVAAILNFESGIGVRNGCFCAHPYLKHLLGITEEENEKLEQQIIQHDRSQIPGAVRMSFGMYNHEKEIDFFVDRLHRIARNEFKGKYELNKRTGEYRPVNYSIDFNDFMTL